jgi:hypothetical protein
MTETEALAAYHEILAWLMRPDLRYKSSTGGRVP